VNVSNHVVAGCDSLVSLARSATGVHCRCYGVVMWNFNRWLNGNHGEIERLKREVQFRESEAVDAVNRWWMACKVLDIPHDSSGGRFRDAVKELKRAACRKFTVTDGNRDGTCYSFYDHFDVWWKDGSTNLGIVELSVYGICKVETPVST